MMNESEFLQHCLNVSGLDEILERPATEPSDLTGLFQAIGKNERKLNELLAPFDCGPEMKTRAWEILDRATHSPDAMYFSSPPSKCDATEAILLLQTHLADLQAIADEMGESDLSTILECLVFQQVSFEKIDQRWRSLGTDSVTGWIYDVITDYEGSLPERETPLRCLHEAYYSISADQMLTTYAMWPIFADGANLDDPFRSYFEIWSRGIRYVIPAENELFFAC